MIPNSIKFAIKVWLTSVLLSPIVFILVVICIDYQKLVLHKTNNSMLFNLQAGFVFSIPILLLFGVAVKFINREIPFYLTKKLLIAIAGPSLAFFFEAFYAGFHMEGISLELGVAYCLTSIAATFMYKLKPDERSVSATPIK